MKIAIVGAGGQLGRELAQLLAGAAALTRAEADLTRPDTLAALAAHKPDLVINCAAYNLVDRAEDEPQAAMAVNADGMRPLAALCRDLGCVLVHFSTDYVYGADERRRTPYIESDQPGPISVYASSKLQGEDLVQALCPRHFVVRTCGLYGKAGQGGKGSNFVQAILKRASAGMPLRVVSDQECTPTATADLARAVCALIMTGAYGLYHITNAGSCSWFGFAQAILENAGLNSSLTPVTTEEWGAKARRPRYSVLDCSKYHALGLPPMRPWQEALRDYLNTHA
jgi:dTDP-4-dehydrorhamnose reductase